MTPKKSAKKAQPAAFGMGAEEAAPLAEEARRAAVAERLHLKRVDRDAARLLAAEDAASSWVWPADEDDGFLGDQLDRPRETPRYLVEGLLGWGHNVLLGAQYKTGKTTIGLNLVRSLVDGKPFLDRDTAMPPGRRVGWVNGEMERDDFLDYARPLGVKSVQAVATLHLRGRRLPLLNDYAAERFTKWLVDREVAVWVVDSWGRLCAWSGISENDNEGVAQLTARVDEIKRNAAVQALVLLAHTGRAKHEMGEEHVRGATHLDDWTDARWIMTKKDGGRFLYAEGRGVQMDETALVFDGVRNRITLGEGNRRTAIDEGTRAALEFVVAATPGLSTSSVWTTAGNNGKDLTAAKRTLRAMERDGALHHTDRRGGPGHYWYPGPRPAGSTACKSGCEFG